MAEFVYQNPFPVKEDTTKYRLITKDFVSTEEFNGRKILKVKPEGLELLAREAFFDVSFFLRSSHMRQLAAILEDPEASDNERFVAYTMIKNQVVSAEGKLPTCQDTGTAIIMAKKGEDVYTGVDDAMHLSKGIFDVWQQNYLRYSILAPLTMTEEKNTTTNLPAQIDIYSSSGNSYEFLIVTKGGGSANKSLLFQQTKSLLNEENLTKFFKEKISELGSAACPPYHLAIVIGGSSAEANLAVVKKASTGYYDNLPTQGNIYGQAFRDLEWEERIKKITQESGIGAQFGGKYFAHDVRVIRLPRHAASCPVGIGVSCSADRNIKAKITEEGIFIEELEKNPERYMPAAPPELSPAVEINLDRPMNEVLAELSKYPVKTRLSLSGTLIVARDVAHARINKILEEVMSVEDTQIDGNLKVYANGVIQAFDKVIAILNDKFQPFFSDKPLQVDWVILQKNCPIPLDQIGKMFTFERVIFDSSNTPWRARQWHRYCTDNQVPFFDVSQSGALVVTL
jgi:fumarate hydratase class I